MATYYDVLSLPEDAPREEIERGLERMATRLKQTGQWEQYQDQFRKIETTLLTPELRAQYDMQNKLKTALRPAGGPPAAKPGTAKMPAAAPARAGAVASRLPRVGQGRIVRVGAVVLALGLAYGAWWLYGHFGRKVDEGIYLLDRGTGEKAAVVLERDTVHLFPGKSQPAPGVLIYVMGLKKAAWVGEAVVDIQFAEGEPAPEAVLKEGRQAAQSQDTHQTLR